jgi:hypothetical protein
MNWLGEPIAAPRPKGVDPLRSGVAGWTHADPTGTTLVDPPAPILEEPMSPTEPSSGNEDLKAKMREALDRKKGATGVAHPAESKEKAHGSEVLDGAPKMHRRKAGGGGS